MLMDEFEPKTTKFLVQNEKEFMAIFADEIEREFQDVQELLGIEFATIHGHYYDLPGWVDEIDDGAEIDPCTYRKFEEYARFPEQYPCVVYLINDKSDHRGAPLTVQILDFIYLTDFITEKTPIAV